MAKIKEKYSKEDIDKMLTDEIREWSDDKDTYKGIGSGGAEDIIIESIIDWVKLEYKQELSKEDESSLILEIKSEFPTLKY